MKLQEMVKDLQYECIQGTMDREIQSLIYDSRKAAPDTMFVCISGAVRDGHDFAGEVVQKGTTVLIVEKDVTENLRASVNEINSPTEVTILKVADSRLALAILSAAWFQHPARELKTIGITGTKGKTTTAYMVRSILEHAGYRTGLIGTVESIIGDTVIPSVNTTPESYMVQEYFRRMVEAGCQCVVMEVSSQALMLHRVGGFCFDYGIFTNLEPDHIGPNEHKDLAEYIHCKGLLFQQCSHGLGNIDDDHFEEVMQGHTCTLETFGMSEAADLRASHMQLMNHGGSLGVAYHIHHANQEIYHNKGIEVSEDFDVEVDIPGQFSVYNSLTAIAICQHFGVSEKNIQEALKDIRVKGRVELLKISSQFTLMIDYAHNAMALESLLSTLQAYHPKRLVCLFGCGGNRARDRRFQMGEISSRMADLTVVTSDNPRNEEPQAIIDDIVTGVKKSDGEYITIPDRAQAIRYVIEQAQAGDVIVLAGKGHEDYQEISGVKHHMDERELVMDVVKDGNYLS